MSGDCVVQEVLMNAMPPGQLRRTRGLLVAGLMLFAMGQTIPFAVMGPVARAIGLAEWQVGVVIAASALTVMLVSPAWGRLSDRWGRKRVIVIGLLAYGLSTTLFAAVLWGGMAGLAGVMATFAMLVATRVLYALGSAGIQPSAVALMADLTSGRDRSAGMALVGAAFGVGTVLGPAVAAGLVGFGVLTPLIAVAAAAIVVAMMAKFQMVDAQRQKAEAMKESAPVRLPEGLPILLAVTFLAYVAVATLQQTAAFFIQNFTGTGAAAETPTPALQPEKPIDPHAVKQTPAIPRARATQPATAQVPSSLQTHHHE
jgi:MFS family permease